jgi:hypothetical protein
VTSPIAERKTNAGLRVFDAKANGDEVTHGSLPPCSTLAATRRRTYLLPDKMLRLLRTDSADRLTSLAALFLAIAAVGTLSAAEPVAAGDWSMPVNGLRGRLLVAYEGASNGPPSLAMAYLELQNLAALGHPAEILYSTRGESCPLSWDLKDADGEPVRRDIVTITGPDSTPDWLVLPEGATLRLCVGWVPAGGTKSNKFSICVCPHKAWSIPKGTDQDYFLSGKFESAPPRGTSDHPSAWQAVLELSAVRISGKPPADSRGIQEPQSITAGEWSERTNGLRGRLLFCGYTRSNSPAAKAAVFLQLDKHGKWGDSLGIYYGTSYVDCPLHWELSDASGQPVPRAGIPREPPPAWSPWAWRTIEIHTPPRQMPWGRTDSPAYASIVQQPSYWLMLPQDSVLTLPLALEGFIGAAEKVQMVALVPEDIWVVPETQKEVYHLAGTFQVPPRQELGHMIFWHGMLKLPQIRVLPPNP